MKITFERILGIFSCLTLVIIGIVFLVEHFNNQNLLSEGERALGVVVSSTNRLGSNTLIQYEALGKTYQIKVEYQGVKEGNIVELVFPTNHPEYAKTLGSVSSNWALIGGLVFVGFTLVVIILAVTKPPKKA